MLRAFGELESFYDVLTEKVSILKQAGETHVEISLELREPSIELKHVHLPQLELSNLIYHRLEALRRDIESFSGLKIVSCRE